MVEVMKIMWTSFKRSHSCGATLSVPQPQSRPMPPPETPGYSQASLGQSLVGSLLLSRALVHTRFCLCPQESISPVLCKFWWFYGGVNGDHLQEGLCHTQVYCTQSPCPCSSPLECLPPQETLKHSSVSVFVGSLGPGTQTMTRDEFTQTECLQ